MKKTFIILGIVLGIVVFGVVVVTGLGALWFATARKTPVTDDDKRMIVRAVDLMPYFDDYSPVDKFESFEKVRYVDQSEELNYDYDSPKEDEPYIAVTVTHERNRRDARLTYSMEWSAQRLGLNIADGDIDLVEDRSFYSGGDRSRFANITYDGDSIGHLFVTQKGRSVYAFTITGIVMDDPTMWRDLFDERIAKLAAD